MNTDKLFVKADHLKLNAGKGPPRMRDALLRPASEGKRAEGRKNSAVFFFHFRRTSPRALGSRLSVPPRKGGISRNLTPSVDTQSRERSSSPGSPGKKDLAFNHSILYRSKGGGGA